MTTAAGINLKPFVSSMLYIPRKMISSGEFLSLKNELTIEIDPDAASPVKRLHDEDFEAKAQLVKAYDLSVSGYIGLPRHFGTKRYPNIAAEDRTSKGHIHKEGFKGTHPIKPRDEKQQDYFERLANVCKIRSGYTDYVAVAKTGTGKTAATISTVIETQKPALIIVHKNTLKEGWLGSVNLKKGLRFFLGERYVEDWVGVVQQNICDYKNKTFVIAMIQTLANRTYPKEFYEYFGSVHFDELHKLTAPHFSEVIKQFPTAVRGGMTATEREDVLKKIAEWHFGPARITSTQEVPPSTVYECRLTQRLNSRQANTYSKASLLNSLVEMPVRNEILANIIYHRGYKRKRQIVVLSDRIKHLQLLQKMLRKKGVPSGCMGLYTGRVYTDKYKCSVTFFDKDANKITHRLKMADGKLFPTKELARKAANEFIKAETKNINRKIALPDIKIDEDWYKISKEYYIRMENRCSIFFATYGIFSEGNDISRLNMGVEASPRVDIRQPMGRVLRINDGPETEWYSIVDDITVVSSDSFTPDKQITELLKNSVSRRKRFKQQGAKIKLVKDVISKFGK